MRCRTLSSQIESPADTMSPPPSAQVSSPRAKPMAVMTAPATVTTSGSQTRTREMRVMA